MPSRTYKRPIPRDPDAQARITKRLAEADAKHKERMHEIDISDAIRTLDNLALADRRGGKRGALAFWQAIQEHVKGEIDALQVEIRNDEDGKA